MRAGDHWAVAVGLAAHCAPPPLLSAAKPLLLAQGIISQSLSLAFHAVPVVHVLTRRLSSWVFSPPLLPSPATFSLCLYMMPTSPFLAMAYP